MGRVGSIGPITNIASNHIATRFALTTNRVPPPSSPATSVTKRLSTQHLIHHSLFHKPPLPKSRVRHRLLVAQLDDANHYLSHTPTPCLSTMGMSHLAIARFQRRSTYCTDTRIRTGLEIMSYRFRHLSRVLQCNDSLIAQHSQKR